MQDNKTVQFVFNAVTHINLQTTHSMFHPVENKMFHLDAKSRGQEFQERQEFIIFAPLITNKMIPICMSA